MSATISINDDAVFTAMRAFLLAVLGSDAVVIQLQDDGVTLPPGPFVGMNNGSNNRLATNSRTYGSAQAAILSPSAYTMALDFYGPDAGAQAAAVQALFRDYVGASLFPADIRPLYADNPVQIPLISGERTWQQRWRLDAVMQTNNVITVDQQTANAARVGLINVDAAYPAT